MSHLRQKLIKLAYDQKDLRDELLPLLRYAASEEEEEEEESGKGKSDKGVSKAFVQFMQEEGDTKVPNPNPKSKEQHPQVKIKSLSSSKEGKKLLKKLFKEWKEDEYEKEDSGKKQKSKSDDHSLPKNKAKLGFGLTKKDIASWKKENKEAVQRAVDAIKSQPISDEKVEEILVEKNHVGKPGNKKEVQEFVREQLKTMSEEEKKFHIYGHESAQVLSDHLENMSGDKAWVDYEYNDFNSSWAMGSYHSHSAYTLGILSKMGVKGYESPEDSEMYAYKSYKKAKTEGDNERDPEMKLWIKEQYMFNQALFDELGLESLTLFRGISEQIEGEPPKTGDEIKAKTRELSSWSTNPAVARRFGRVVKVEAPVETIFSGYMNSPKFGGKHVQGNEWGEAEIVLMGSSDLVSKVISDPEE